MSTFYLDYENGNDANAGDSFAAGHPWKTITLGATAARIAPGDIIRIAKSPIPVDLGCTAQWTTNTKVGGGMPATMSITGTANNGAGLIRVQVADTSTLATNDTVQILSTGGTIEANENWLITVIDGTHFDLIGSAYSAAWTSGGTVQKINSKAVVLGTAQTANVDLCESPYTAVTGLITVLNVTPTNGGTGYAANDTFNITTGGTGATGKVTTVTGGVVTAVSIVTGGNGGYATGAGKATVHTSGSGDDALTVNITTVASAVQTPTAIATDAKEGAFSEKIATPTAVKAGSKLAYRAITPGSLAGYQNLSFWIKNSAAITAGQWRIVLCSGATGETIVDEFLIPAIPSTGTWLPLTITKTGGGNLGASTASIAVYADTVAPATASNIIIDNVIACTTTGLNLQSLISTNTSEKGGTEGWYGIQSINGKIVLLDNATSTKGNAGYGYSGTTQLAETYIRETIKTAMVSSSTTAVQEVMDSGTVGSNIQFQGGYDTGTGEQTGETFFDGLNSNGYGIQLSGKTYCTLNYLNVIRYYTGVYITAYSANNTITTLSNANNNSTGVNLNLSSNNTITTISNANNNGFYNVSFTSSNNNTITTISNANGSSYGVNLDTVSSNNTITTISNANNNAYGMYFAGQSANNTITTLSNANNNSSSGVYFTYANNNTITTATNVNNSTQHGIAFINSFLNEIGTLSTTGNGSSGVSNNYGVNYIQNATVAESPQVLDFIDFTNSKVYLNELGGTYSKIFTDGGTIESQASTLTNGSGKEWLFTTVTNTNRSLSPNNYPLILSIAKIAVTANNAVTVTVWCKKGDATNIGARLVCVGGQLAGVSTDVYDEKANDTNEENLTISFTPTESGVIEIEAWAYYIAGHSTVIFDAMTISQA